MTKIPALHPTIRAWLLEARSGVLRATQAGDYATNLKSL